MRKRQVKAKPSSWLEHVMLAGTMLLCGCTASTQTALHSLLEQEKASIRENFARNIGATPQELSRAFDSSLAVEMQAAAQVTDAMVLRHGRSSDVEMENHLQGIARKLSAGLNSPGFRYRVILLDDDRINAFTPGGGIILVKEGLLSYCDTEAQVAAVLAHEIAHIVLRHPHRLRRIEIARKTGGSVMKAITPEELRNNVGKMLRLGGKAGMNSMIRAQEYEADSLGIDILVNAGYDPRGMVEIQQQLQRYVPQLSPLANVIYGNHPLSRDRELAAQKKINQVYPHFRGRKDSQAFQKLIARYHARRLERLANRL